ncbi:predicted protein [Naegleria gruberi]|uniref:Predicted protein n=1 Tax=Naegleria gruberi TaxID=5762 RepID=D2VAM8_NAEGR|nr:uncharacterized protein NAEGRDRAFT_47995 [Naegleria gruberi]EFC46103.1 predicted protein [Naegleria gruberi]|eukprot:XP_002678847.1 predicted protein [Naegleria gruberi strain NEG-M]
MTDLILPNLKSLSLKSVKSLTYRNNKLNIEQMNIENIDTTLLECLPVAGVVKARFCCLQCVKIERNMWNSIEELGFDNIEEVHVDIDRLESFRMARVPNGIVRVEHVKELVPPPKPSSVKIHIDSVDEIELVETNAACLEHIHTIKQVVLTLNDGKLKRAAWDYIMKINCKDIRIKCWRPIMEMIIDCTKYDIKSISYDECFVNGEPKMNRFTTAFSHEIRKSDMNIETLSNLSFRSSQPFYFSMELNSVPVFEKLTSLSLALCQVHFDLSILPQLNYFSLSDGKAGSKIFITKPHPALKFVFISQSSVHLNCVIDCPQLREFILSKLKLDENSRIEINNLPKILTFYIDDTKEYLEKGQLVIKDSIRF